MVNTPETRNSEKPFEPCELSALRGGEEFFLRMFFRIGVQFETVFVLRST